MKTQTLPSASSAIAGAAIPLGNDYAALLQCIGNAEIVLIGEASHGTHEFYSIREQITRRLIADHGFQMVVLEADWPDALRVHGYVTGQGEDRTAEEALGDFRRFPTWMWRNTVMKEFVEWLKQWNAGSGASAGIFGMDLYSMHRSIDAVLDYLQQVDPEAAGRARRRYGCFDHFGGDPQEYGYATTRGGEESCENDVVAQLLELRHQYLEGLGHDGKSSEDEFFFAQQNARLVVNAERYYRSMFRGRNSSWNLRDQHMTDTLTALDRHFDGGTSKMVVWAHNSHLGDARATEMGARGEWNVGQLMRERFGDRVFNIGFSSYTGTVTAARNWGDSAERRRVRPGLPGSYEALFHETGIPRLWLDLRAENTATDALRREHLQRAIGVIYRPETERYSHYFESSLSAQFDVIIHIDEAHALKPLERNSEWAADEFPDTYPAGL